MSTLLFPNLRGLAPAWYSAEGAGFAAAEDSSVADVLQHSLSQADRPTSS